MASGEIKSTGRNLLGSYQQMQKLENKLNLEKL